MKKEKMHLEYPLNSTSKQILWGAISTPSGLEDWFADRVVSNDKNVIFHWGKTEQREAEITAIRAFSFIRFRWMDDDNEQDYLGQLHSSVARLTKRCTPIGIFLPGIY